MGRRKPPNPPLCLCNDVFHWRLGIVSPCRELFYIPKNEREARKIKKYKEAMKRWREVKHDVY